MEITIILIIIYVASFYGAYKFVQLAHYHKEGKWTNTKPSNIDLFVTCFPGFNSVLSVLFLLGDWKKDCYKETNFFKMKKINGSKFNK